MSDKPPENKDNLLELLKRLWLPVAGFIGVVTVAYNFYKLWLGDQATVTYITAGAGLVVLVIVLGWVGFSTKTVEREADRPFGSRKKESVPRYPHTFQWTSRILLGIILALVVGGAWSLFRKQQELRAKVVVLVAQFDGPEEKYGLRRQLMEDLQEATKGHNDTVIIEGDELVTSGEYAREIGEKVKADLVIWTWYRPTENPNITVHIENLSPNQIVILQASETYQPQATLAQLESFEIQQKLGSETSTLITFIEGMLKFISGDYQTAKERFEQILDEKDLSTFIKVEDLYFNLGYSNGELGNIQDAMLNYNKVIEINSQVAAAHLNLGNLYLHMNQYARAIESYTKAIDIDANYEDAYYDRGIAHNNLGETDLAIQDYNKALELNPHDSYAYNNLGWIYYNLKEYERAIPYFDKAIEYDRQNPQAYINRGLAYDKLGDYEQALKDYTQHIKVNPKDADAYNNRGLIYADYYKKYNRAIRDYDKAIGINPNSEIIFENRANAYLSLKKYERAASDCEKAIEINSNYVDAYITCGGAYLILGKYEDSVQNFDKALKIKPEYSEIYRFRGLAYQKLGKTAEAEADFKKYEELTGKKP